MSSSRGGGNSKGKHVSEVNSHNVDQLSRDVGEINLDSSQDDGNWEEVIGRKLKNRAGSTTAKPWGSQSSSAKSPWGQQDAQKSSMWGNGGSGRAAGNVWAQAADSRKPAGRGNGRQQSAARVFENRSVAPQHVIPPPLDHGWNWQSRAGFTQPKAPEDDKDNNAPAVDNDGDEVSDTDSDDDLSDEFDSDASVKSHGTRKKNQLLKTFFEVLDSLTVAEINNPERQWHCPACQKGPGAIDWYRGLQPLMTHAKTKGSIRAKLHRELAELLDEELRRRGTTVAPAGEAFGKWKGLTVELKDHEIVWPPMVIVMNTRLEQDDNDKWIGMGNQELLDYFSSYAAVKARHSYGPQGHRGMSLLIFEASARGYFEAERLHRHFVEQGTDRNAWDRTSRALYGCLRLVEIVNFIKFQDKEMEDFVAERDMLIKAHGENKAAMKRRHWEEEVGLEKDFNDKLTQLMDKYSKVEPEAAANFEG